MTADVFVPVVVIAAVCVGIIELVAWRSARRLHRYAPGRRDEIRWEVRRVLGQWAGGLLLAVGAVTAWRTFEAQQQQQIDERFVAAVELLSHQSSSARTGGILALEQIATDAPDRYHGAVTQLLCSHIRSASPSTDSTSAWPTDSLGAHRVREEIQVALGVLGRRDSAAADSERWDMDLTRAYLGKASLLDGRFERANFHGSDLRRANLVGTHLAGGNLIEARLADADMRDADLRDALLCATDLRGARSLTPGQLLTARLPMFLQADSGEFVSLDSTAAGPAWQPTPAEQVDEARRCAVSVDSGFLAHLCAGTPRAAAAQRRRSP